jgi:hypothetical protein
VFGRNVGIFLGTWDDDDSDNNTIQIFRFSVTLTLPTLSAFDPEKELYSLASSALLVCTRYLRLGLPSQGFA